jgi:hypothetical protein
MAVDVPFDSRPANDRDLYLLNVGPDGFKGMQKDLSWLLIHELTHVWQSAHSAWPPSFIFNSLWHQMLKRDRAYEYKPGAGWKAYNVEQQAMIVQDWFERSMDPNDPNYTYIRDVIRAAKPLR